MRIEILTVCNQLVGAAANGIYQGIIVTALVGLGLRALPRTNAATRHAVWFCTLLLLVSLLVAHCLIGPAQASRMNEAASVSDPDFDVVAVPGMNSSKIFLTPDTEEPLDPITDLQLLSSVDLTETEVPAESAIPRPVIQSGNERLNVASVNQPLPAAKVEGETTRWRWLEERLVNPVSLNLTLGSRFSRIASLILVAVWLAIAGARVFGLVWQLARIQRLKRCSFPANASLSETFQKLVSRLGVKRGVTLRISPMHRSSFLLGFLHPVILLPAEGRMEPEEAELVLRHELAHVQRFDDWANLVQHFILAVFFFHPAAWWVSKKLTLEREIACDDHVLQQSGRLQAYALLLTNLAARLQRGLPLLAPGSSNNKTQLKERIDMILNTNRNRSPHLAKSWLALVSSATALLAAGIIGSAPRLVVAQGDATPVAKSTSADASLVSASGGITSVALTTNPDDPDSADNSPGTAAPAAVGAGPKFKPGTSSTRSISRVVMKSPPVPVAPVPAVSVDLAPAPVPSPIVATIELAPPAPAAPRPVRAPRPGNKDSSIEERLERVERMLESLMHQQKEKQGRVDYQLKAEKGDMIDRKEIAKIETLAKHHAELSRKHMMDPQEIEKVKELAAREAGRATELAKRAAADADKAVKVGQKRQMSQKHLEGSQKQLEAMRKQLEILERERQKLDQQIEQLERDQEQLDEQHHQDLSGDSSWEESNAENPANHFPRR